MTPTIRALCRIAILLAIAWRSEAVPPGWPEVSIRDPLPGFQNPTHITHAGDGSGRLFVTEQQGRILVVSGGIVAPTPFLDIRSRVGWVMHGVAFPPGYAQKGWFYVKYQDDAGTVILSRFRRSAADPNVADATTEQAILSIPDGAESGWGHAGGPPVFRQSDGYLYVSQGDGDTDQGDPGNHAQNPADLRGKMLRLDVETGAPVTYTIPPTNPFVGNAAYRPEIWALGLRNPWRFSFDRETSALHIADVGRELYEEIDYEAAADTGGKNYGWRIMEANHCHDPDLCDPTGLVLPVHEYDRSQGCSIIGGSVARGSLYPAFHGIYFFGDYCEGKIWGLRTPGVWESALLLDAPFKIVTFGEDEAGALYVSDDDSGVVYRLTDEPPAPFDLTVAKSGSGTGTVTSNPAGINCGIDCVETYAVGALLVRLTAIPAAGSVFVNWSGACTGSGPCVVTMDAARSVTAVFSGAPPPVVASVASRRVHGAAGTFDLPLVTAATNPTTEPRQGPTFTIVFTFNKPVTAGVATVTSGTAVAGAATFSGNEMRVPLSGVANQQYVTVTVSNVTSSDGGAGGTGSIRVGFLLGDVDQSRVVTLADLGHVNAQVAQWVTAANFLKDLNASGTLSLADKGITNNQITRALPAP